MDKYQQDILDVVLMILALKDTHDTIVQQTGQDKPLFVSVSDLENYKIDETTFLDVGRLLRKKGWAGFQAIDHKFREDLVNIIGVLQDKPEVMEHLIQSQQVQQIQKGIDFTKKSLGPLAQAIPDLEEEITPDDATAIMHESVGYVSDIKEDTLAILHIMPNKDLQKLVHKMKQGMPFDEIYDEIVFYDDQFQILYLNELQITIGQKNDVPNIHYILKYIFKNKPTNKQYYDEMNDKNILGDSFGNRTYQDACLGLQKRITKLNPNYKDFMKITTTDACISSKYFEWLEDVQE